MSMYTNHRRVGVTMVQKVGGRTCKARRAEARSLEGLGRGSQSQVNLMQYHPTLNCLQKNFLLWWTPCRGSYGFKSNHFLLGPTWIYCENFIKIHAQTIWVTLRMNRTNKQNDCITVELRGDSVMSYIDTTGHTKVRCQDHGRLNSA